MSIPAKRQFRISIKTKLLLYILTATIIGFSVVLGYILLNTNKNAIEDGSRFVTTTAIEYAYLVKSELENDAATCRTLAQAMSSYDNITIEESDKLSPQLLREILQNNPHFISIWVSWELNAIDPDFNEINGRIRHNYYRQNGKEYHIREIMDIGELSIGGVYYDIKNNPRELITDPYFYSYTNDNDNRILEASIAVPIMRDGEFIGLAGADIDMERFYSIIDNIKPFEGSYSIMISNTGKIVSHNDKSFVDKSIFETELGLNASINLQTKIEEGVSFAFSEKNKNDQKVFVSFAPFRIGKTCDPWYIAIVVPSSIILENANHDFLVSIIVAIIGLILLGIIIWIIARSISKPLIKTTNILNQLSTGDVKNISSFTINTRDELSEMAKAVQTLANSMKTSADFATDIGKGNLSSRYKPLGNNDILGNSLIQMRDSLLDLRNVNDKNQWRQTSMVKISELLQGEKSITELGDQVLTTLAEILDIQIAAIFFNNDEVLELTSSYSYSTRKGNANKFKFGEGLVGQAARERKSLIFTDVPDDYISIKSGLGETKPSVIVVVPLIYNRQVIAVVEIGSVKEISEEKMMFLNQISENIALAFSTIVARSEMEILLEKTQEQAEELKVQQEELVSSNKELEDQTNALRVSEEELQQQQEELRVTNEELEEKTKSLEEQKVSISNKNLELENIRKNLEQKAKELHTASKYKSEFLANMSHELRTPLNSLLILSGSLMENEEGNLDEEQVESARIIYKSGNDLLNMINDILDLSKIESGKMSVNHENVKIKTISDNMIGYFKQGANQKNISLKVNISDKLPEIIFTDQQKVEQIVKNFMSNALKFTNKGSITLDFDEFDRNDEKYIKIGVIDTGIGIPEEKQQAIFEAFQQADGSISRKFGGTGLGLSISRELSKLLGGYISLVSKQGEGSTFAFCMPINGKPDNVTESLIPENKQENTKEKNTTDNNHPTTKEDMKTISSSDFVKVDFIKDDTDKIHEGDQVILVIEDDPNFAKILYKQCQSRGFKCIASPTGEQGFKIAARILPSAIILDIKLPGIDGWRVLDLLKENPSTRHIPVHIMSGDEETIAASSKGAIGYLTKPINKKQLEGAFGKIETFVNKKTGKLLLVEDDENLRKSIKILVGDNNVEITDAPGGEEALKLLKDNVYDCMILDLGLSDMTGFQLIEKINNANVNKPPIIVYTGKDLTKEENETLQRYAESIIIKGVKSEERLLDETSLFMHRVISEMPDKQQMLIKKIHNSDDVFKDKRVLIVDDDMRNIFALTKVLKSNKLIVERAENGKTALDIVKNNKPFDAILMDIMMPEMDGYTAIQEIRKLKGQKNVPIIALTAKAMKEDRQKCIDAGANDYMAKPIVVEKLLSLLRVWLYK